MNMEKKEESFTLQKLDEIPTLTAKIYLKKTDILTAMEIK